MELRFRCIRCFFNYHFWSYISFFGVTVKFLFMIGQNSMIKFFSGFAGCSSYGYAFTIDTLRGSLLVNGFAWCVFLSWFISWFNSLGFYCTTSLTSDPKGISGGVDFLNISDSFLNASLCPFPILASGFVGDGFFFAHIKSCGT